MREGVRNAVAIAIAIALLCIPAAIIRVSLEISWVGAEPAIEQLRSDMDRVADPSSEDVIGQATAWNQKIRTFQAYNARWWGDPFIPDDWDNVAVLTIPKNGGTDRTGLRVEPKNTDLTGK